jgi:hypothetical protein
MNIITTKRLGTFGRWGNSLGLYSFAKKYSEIYQSTLQTPSWDGQKVFNIFDPPISVNLPQTDCDQVPWGETNIDLLGYYQNEKFLKIMNRKWLKNLFTFKQKWIDLFPKPKPFYIAAHLRRGDYVGLKSIYALISQQSYINACKKFDLNIEDIIWISEEKPIINQIAENEGIPWLGDFMTIYNADIILRANSTFSWWGATLSNAKVYSPIIDNNRGDCDVDFVEGNWPKLANFTKNDGPQDHGDLFLSE